MLVLLDTEIPAMGVDSLNELTTGGYNSGFGQHALNKITTGMNNVAIGYNSGGITTTGSNNISLGSDSSTTTVNIDGQCTLGSTSITNLRCNDTSISSLSDSRDKTNVVDIPLGLSFLNTVRPVSFDWDRRDGSMAGKKDFGFIAQELKVAADATIYANHMRLVDESNPDRLEADPMKMFPILVKAIQELSAKNDALTARITALEGN